MLGRSEYGLEIVTEIAYLVYIVGLSFDKVCLLLGFFQNLRLRKSRVDKLLYRLSREWEHEFDLLCALLANSLVVHADETSWSLNSVWAFLSEKARVLLYGVHKDAATLEKMVDPASFAGIAISDDAAVYGNFSAAQKCWAHLLRKAIKLTLQDPDNAEYRAFTDRLLEIYREACRVQRDQRPSDEGRRRKVSELEDELIRATQRHHQTGGWDEQRGRADVARHRPGAADGPDEQDAPRRPPPNDFDQRPAIASSLPADLHAFDRAR